MTEKSQHALETPFFKPDTKYALLISGRDNETGYHFPVKIEDRWHPHITMNRHLYDWELLFTGRLDLGEYSPLNKLNNVDKSIEEFIELAMEDTVEIFEKDHCHFEEAIKIFSGGSEVYREFVLATDRLNEITDEISLTQIVLFSHGEVGSIGMGNSDVTYPELLLDLDKINGKKVLFLYACYSGSILDSLDKHVNKQNYSIFTSSDSSIKSTNWDDRALDNLWFSYIVDGKKLSELPLLAGEHGNKPQRRLYFDARIK